MTVVAACLRDGRGGSPTAVLLPDTSVDDVARREVPVRLGTSHAVFVTMDGPVAVLRFFTREGELPACGHGTVAAIALLSREAADGPDAGTKKACEVTLRAAGRTFLGRAARDGDRIEAAFDPGPVTVRAATPAERVPVGAALGVEAGAATVATLGEGGRPRMLLPISGRDALAALAPDLDRLRAACDRFGLLGCYAYTEPETGGHLAARMFAPSIGVPEDIANANSTACLAAHLGTDIRVDMGDSLGVPATVTASARPLLVGGAAVVPGKG